MLLVDSTSPSRDMSDWMNDVALWLKVECKQKKACTIFFKNSFRRNKKVCDAFYVKTAKSDQDSNSAGFFGHHYVYGQTLSTDCANANKVWLKMGGTPALPTSCCSRDIVCSTKRITQLDIKLFTTISPTYVVGGTESRWKIPFQLKLEPLPA